MTKREELLEKVAACARGLLYFVFPHRFQLVLFDATVASKRKREADVEMLDKLLVRYEKTTNRESFWVRLLEVCPDLVDKLRTEADCKNPKLDGGIEPCP
jgi:hypothetical protein